MLINHVTKLTAFVIFVFCLFLCPQETSVAVPAQDGQVQNHVGGTFRSGSPNDLGVVWTHEVKVPGSNFVQIHFSDIRSTTDQDYLIEVRNANNLVVESYSKAQFATSRELWSVRVRGSYALLVARTNGQNAILGLQFVVDKVARSSPGGHVLSLVAHDLQYSYVYYSVVPGLEAAARSVGRVAFIRDNLTWTCSGFLVSSNQFITNAHCVRQDSDCINGKSTVTFGFQYLPPSPPAQAQLNTAEDDVRCLHAMVPVPNTDVAVLTLVGSPGEKWGHLTLATTAPQPFTQDPAQLWLIGYPDMDFPERVSQTLCQITVSPTTIAGAKVFGHTCDTQEGSSGSPVVNKDMKVLGVHFQQFIPGDPTWSATNAAVTAASVQGRF